MITNLANVTLLVKDYDEAIRWYTEKLGLELRMDGSMGGEYRFVTVGVKGQQDVSIVLHKPFEGYQEARSNVHGLLFHCDNCRAFVERLKSAGVEFTLALLGQLMEMRRRLGTIKEAERFSTIVEQEMTQLFGRLNLTLQD